MAKRPYKDEVWCRRNVTPEEGELFWAAWSEGQWGLPTFALKRIWVENLRKRKQAA